MGNPQSPILLALDFGGTKLAAALMAPGEERWRARAQVLSPPGSDACRNREAILSLAWDLLGREGATPAAVGASFGGPVDADQGLVLLSHHVPGWERFPLRDWLQAQFGAPAAVDNDANAGALGEWRYGAGQALRLRSGQAHESLLYVTVSTGVGGGWVLNGRVYHGADGLAGEIGHMTIQPGGPVCTCGRRGCLEALAAGPAIARRARERLLAEPQAGSLLRQLAGGDGEAVTAEHVSRAAEAGDMLARQILDEAARALGLGIGNAIALMNPQRVVVGGGVAKAGERYFEVVRAAARANVLRGMTVDIVPAMLGDDAPLWGAMALAEELVAAEFAW